MKIGIGLPNPIPGASGETIIEWAVRAESLGFSTVATIDRIAYPSYDSIVTLSAVAGATERIGLFTNVVLAPTHNPVLLAKEAASLDRLSGGRLVLGLGVGRRPDDFAASEQDFHTRGKRFDRDLEIMHAAWRGELVLGAEHPVGPQPTTDQRVPILFGGMSDRSIERTVRYGIGWTAGGAAADQVGPYGERVRQAWREGGREGEPRIAALAYFGFGEFDDVARFLVDYYGPYGNQVAQAVPRTAGAARETVRRFEDSGVDEFILDPTIAELDQVERLAEAVL